MFEALFILTTLDAGTRVGRYLLQDVLGGIWKPLGDTRRMSANVFASVLVVAGWGYFLIQGVRDPLGGINSLWPLFGIANQLLAAIALCLGTTIILKTMLVRKTQVALALVTLVPLVWLLTVTMTAGWQKIFHADPKIGFLAAAHALDADLPKLQQATSTPDSANATAANRSLRFNYLLDVGVAGTFLVLVALVVIVSAREWLRLIAGRASPRLQETEPVWLPLGETPPARAGAFGAAALAFALLREISGQAAIDRAASEAETTIVVRGRQNILLSDQPPPDRDVATPYLAALEHRYSRISRCC